MRISSTPSLDRSSGSYLLSLSAHGAGTSIQSSWASSLHDLSCGCHVYLKSGELTLVGLLPPFQSPAKLARGGQPRVKVRNGGRDDRVRGASAIRPARQDGQASGRRVDRPRWLCALARLRSGRRGGGLGHWHEVPHPHASGSGWRWLARARRARRGVRTAQPAALLPRPARAYRHAAARVCLRRRR